MHHVEKIVLLKNDSGMKTLFFLVGAFHFLQRDLQHLQGVTIDPSPRVAIKANQRPRQAEKGQGVASSHIQRPQNAFGRHKCELSLNVHWHAMGV